MILDSAKTIIARLVSTGWTIRSIAHALDVTERTVYRWHDIGTKHSNQERLALLSGFDATVFGSLSSPYGVHYLQREGESFVKIGESQDLSRTLRGFQKCHAVPVRLVAWHPNSRARDHFKRWEALRRRGEWFEYHPDMEQEEDKPVFE